MLKQCCLLAKKKNLFFIIFHAPFHISCAFWTSLVHFTLLYLQLFISSLNFTMFWANVFVELGFLCVCKKLWKMNKKQEKFLKKTWIMENRARTIFLLLCVDFFRSSLNFFPFHQFSTTFLQILFFGAKMSTWFHRKYGRNKDFKFFAKKINFLSAKKLFVQFA